MKQKKWIIGVIAVVVVGLTFWQVSKMITSAEPLTAEEAANKVIDLYDGEIVEVAEDKETYFITIELEDTGIYEVEIDRETGEIGRMTRTKVTAGKDQTTEGSQQGDSKEQPTPQNGQPAEKPDEQQNGGSEKPASEVPNSITEAQAITIALGQVNGEVDDVEMASIDGTTYYLVEIEGEDDEATVKIHGITGEVISIFWDD